MITKVISGGQSGVDKAALDAARELGIATGGWIPKGFRTEEGPRPVYQTYYGLQEMNTNDYPSRTHKNIEEADATLIIVPTGYVLSGGTKLTARLAGQRGLVILADISGGIADKETATQVKYKLTDYIQVNTLNVGGPEESKCPGIYDLAKRFMLEVLRS